MRWGNKNQVGVRLRTKEKQIRRKSDRDKTRKIQKPQKIKNQKGVKADLREKPDQKQNQKDMKSGSGQTKIRFDEINENI